MIANLNKDTKLHIHFVGIGGISMSGIAHILLSKGHKITGSDKNPSPITERLKAKGATIYEGHRPEHIDNPQLVVYTSAVGQNNAELVAAREKGIETVDRAAMLGSLMKEYRYNVAIAGVHGKTTTTSMVSLIVEEAGFDPTLLIGGELDKIGGNVKTGKGPYLITEACEYRENFLKFHPYVAVILNIDEDHLDFFKDFEHIKSAFKRFANLVPDHGQIVAYHGDKAVMEVISDVSCKVITYGLDEGAQIQGKNMAFDEKGCATFDLYNSGNYVDRIRLAVPGEHNVLNSLAAITVGCILHIDIDTIKTSLGTFTGTHRRFEIKGTFKNCTIVDDYAHHPAEIRATLKAAQNFSHNRIWGVFQPHTYTRTKFLLEDFAKSFSKADKVIITDIYAARERDSGEIHSTHLVDAINAYGQRAVYMPSFKDAVYHLSENLQEGDLVLTLGAGNVHKIGEMLLNRSRIY